MALRIRRGLSADRTTITPEQGEFLYTTDTYQVYIGDGVTAGGRALYTLASLGAIGLTDLSATSPLSYNNTTGVFSIQAATGSQAGYLSSADWTTFNSKQNSLEIFDETTSIVTNPSQIKFVGTPVTATVAGSVVTVTISGTGGGGGGVTGVSVATANGLAGVSDLNAVNPTLTLSTTVTGLLKGNGTAISAATAGTDYQAALTGTGLVNSAGGTISYIANNSTNWNTAYSQRIDTLTTTGNSGAATFIGNILNIPNYTAAGIGAIASTRQIATTSPLQGGGDLSADRTLSILQATSSQSGYLSSADWSTFNSKQAALSGTGIVKSTAGTITYLTDNSSNWNTAFGWGDHSLAGYLLSSTAASTYVPQTRNLTIDGVTQNLTADRTFTINKALNDLTDVTTTSPLGGDLLQYNGATSQWINVPLSVLTSVGADNGLSFSGGDVILGGELDNATIISTYNTVTLAQHSLTFTAGATAFSSPGTAPIRITETTAYSAGRSAFYVGANDNHAVTVEGKGAPVTTAPTYKYERTSANLLKNATIHSKAKQGLGLYTNINSDEAYTSITRYATPSIPAILIEKTTGLIDNTIATGVTPIPSYDIFLGNQLFNLLTLRLSRSAATTNFVDYSGVEMSFEKTNQATSDILQLTNLRAYSISGETSAFSITTRVGDVTVNGVTTSINDEYTGLQLQSNGVLVLPAYKTATSLFRDLLFPSVDGVTGAITSIISGATKPRFTYGDTVTLNIIDEAGTATSSATGTLTLGYSLKRIRITNPGSGYVTAPTVTISAPPSGGTPPPGGNGWVTGTQAVGVATLTSTGEVDFIKLSNPGTRYTSIPTVTISAPPSGVTATAVAEFGDGEVLNVIMSSGGLGYTSGKTKAVIASQTYTGDIAEALLGVNSSGTVVRTTIGLDYLLNSDQAGPYGTGPNLLHDTVIQAIGYTLSLGSAQTTITSSGTGVAATNDGRLLLGSIKGSNRIYRYSYPEVTTNPYATNEGITNLVRIETSQAVSDLIQTVYSGGTYESGVLFNYYGEDVTSQRFVDLYASCSISTPASPSGLFSGPGIGFNLKYDDSYSNIKIEYKQLNFNLSSSQWGTSGDASVFTTYLQFIQQNNNTANYDIELGSGYIFNASGYLEDTALAAAGTYTADMLINTGTLEGFRGIELVVNSDFDPLTNAISKVQVNTNSIYNELNSNVWTTGATIDVYARFTQSLQKLNDTNNYDTEAGGKYNLHTKGYYEEGVDIGDYNSIVNINSTSEGGSFRGIELIANSNFNPATGIVLDGESKIQVSSTRIYIKPDNLGTINQVLKVANATTGELGYTTLAAVATSGSYADLSGTPTIPTTLDSLTNVNAPSPTNGQVLSYNSGVSEWQAVTFSASGLTLRTNTVTNGSQAILDLKQGTNITIVDDGVGGVTINSTGGGGVGLDTVFMLMGA